MLDGYGMRMHTDKWLCTCCRINSNQVVVEGCPMGEEFSSFRFSVRTEVRSAGYFEAYVESQRMLFLVMK